MERFENYIKKIYAGSVWGLTPLEQAMYKEDKERGLNLKNTGTSIYWDKERAIRDRLKRPNYYKVKVYF